MRCAADSSRRRRRDARTGRRLRCAGTAPAGARGVKLLCDARVFELQRRGGISRVYREVLPRLCGREPDLRVQLLSARPLLQPPPEHPSIEPRRVAPLDGRVARRVLGERLGEGARSLALGLAVRRGADGGVWHSTYYTRPLGWRGPSLAIAFDLIYELFPELYRGAAADVVRRSIRGSLQSADHILCISENTRRDVVERYGVPESMTSIVPLASSLEGAGGGAGAPPSALPKPYLLFVGQRGGYKNFLGLLAGASGWLRRGEVALVCAGGAPAFSGEEAAAIAALGESARVLCLGEVSDAQLAALYRGAACFVYPSLYEGFGIPVLEAMQCGTPALLARAASLPEVGGDAALYFDPAEPDAMRAALGAALEMGDEARGARVAAGKAWAARFSWENSAQAFAEALRRLG